MAVDEQARHRLHMRLDELVGAADTRTLMELLPPLGWANMATKQDLAQGLDSLGHRVDAQVAELRAELHEGLGGLRSEIAAGQRLLLFGVLTAMFTLTGLVWAAVTVAG